MKRYFHIYLHFVKSSFQLFLAHRFNFLMGVIANILWTISQLITLKYLFAKIPDFQGWEFGDLILLLGFGQIFVYASFTVFDLNLDRLLDKIISGAFDRMLTKPINIQFLASFEQLSIATLIPMLTTVAPLIIYGLVSRHTLDPFAIIFSFIGVFLGVIILYFLSLSLTGLTFYYEDIKSIKEFVVMRTNDIARIPLTVFPKFIQLTLTFIVPIAFVAYYPAQIVRGQSSAFAVIATEFILILIFWQISRIVWNSGLKRYSGIG